MGMMQTGLNWCAWRKN